ncbi:UNVERIFIED_CONTAM: NOL1/NOP2/Sun domain member 3 [Gekko kuhli]
MWLLRRPGPLPGISPRPAARQLRKPHSSALQEVSSEEEEEGGVALQLFSAWSLQRQKGRRAGSAGQGAAVLALDIENGEKVLDMCAAPGGKSVATLQYACPGLLQSNEYDNLRSYWLRNTLESFIPESMMNLVIISQLDGRQIGNLQPERFDKVLVDAPCSNDRSWLFSSDIQQATLRLAQRKELSAVQIQLLSLMEPAII